MNHNINLDNYTRTRFIYNCQGQFTLLDLRD